MGSISTLVGTIGFTVLLATGLAAGCYLDDPTNQNAIFMGTADGVSFYTSLVNDGMSYSNVKEYCEFFNFKPAIIDTREKDEVIRNFLLYLSSPEFISANPGVNSRPFWLTLNDNKTEGTFLWDESSLPPTYFNWATGSPHTDDTNYNCVSPQLDSLNSYGWLNLPCGTCWRPVCQRASSN